MDQRTVLVVFSNVKVTPTVLLTMNKKIRVTICRTLLSAAPEYASPT